MKKSVSAICEIMNINTDFSIFVDVSHMILKKHSKKNKIKTMMLKMLWYWHVPKIREKYSCLAKLELLKYFLGTGKQYGY